MFFHNDPPCPACGKHSLSRIPRHPLDRVLSLFVKLRRYRCLHPACGWEGRQRANKN